MITATKHHLQPTQPLLPTSPDVYDDDDNNDNDDSDNDLVFLGNHQPWSDAFLAEGGWVISTMMTMMRMTTMATTMKTTIADGND